MFNRVRQRLRIPSATYEAAAYDLRTDVEWSLPWEDAIEFALYNLDTNAEMI